MTFAEDLYKTILVDRTISTAKEYMKRLQIANNGKEITSLTFCKDIPTVLGHIKHYSDNTRKSIIAAIIVAIKTKKWNALAAKYYKHMMETVKEDDGKLTEKQKEAWMSWEDVIKVRDAINTESFDGLQQYFLLCLYTMNAPRRNVDYQVMHYVEHYSDTMDNKKNYMTQCGLMVFNVYKTSYSYGRQMVQAPPEFLPVLHKYVMRHPLKDEKEFPLLVTKFNKAYGSGASITGILNRIFSPKKIGVSMLRHIYLTTKYKGTLTSMAKDAKNMAHSTGEQRNYVRFD